ncbi:MAG: ArnT family glycosyltransferase [Planctomycetota bacterium]|jgi:4-amino-4-deoxy-L-arabinose transferase-like glycosyltransferase
MTKNTIENGSANKKNYLSQIIWIGLLVVVLFVVVVRVRLLDIPLERDEGEYAYAGQLILDGVMPYARVYNMKMPGIYFAYATIEAVFGQTCRGIHLGLLVINIATILVLFFLARELFGPEVALASAAAFGLLCLGASVQGIMANAEHFVILPALAGIYCLVVAVRKQCLVLLAGSGLLLGMAFLMKQHGAAFIVFAGFYLCIVEFRRKPFNTSRFAVRIGLFSVGIILPFAVICLVLWYSGVFEKFWFWTFEYAREYVSSVPFSAGLELLMLRFKTIAGSAVAIWILSGVGAAGTLLNPTLRKRGSFVWCFVLFSFLGICPGFYFRPHYFILLLPAVALLGGLGVKSCFDIFSQNITLASRLTLPIVIMALVLFASVYQQREFIFQAEPTKVSRIMYGVNPFPESLELSRFIKDNSQEQDSIAVIGSEPQIYFYSNRRSATGYIYTYALMESHKFASKMQDEMIGEIEEANPKFLVFVNIATSWLVQSESDTKIFTWFERYYQQHYEMAAVVDIISDTETIYRWNEDARNYSPRSPYWVGIYKRKSQ